MSNSAFTPTQIEVTNEVPVNVPVVEAWNEEALTWNQNPGLSTTGSYIAPKIKWRRVGSSMEGFYDFRNGGSISSNNVQVSFRLPNNLTIDSTKFTALPASLATVGFARKGSTYEYINYFPGGAGTPSKSIYITGGTNAQFAADYIGGGWFSVPIAEWAGSGTTTLATRAVEEYASNSSTSDASDTTSFVYGPNGATTPGPLTAYRTKRVRFQTPILSTDSIYLEGRASLTSPWAVVQALDGGNGLSPLQLQAGVYYGIGLNASLINSTDIDVSFGRYAFSNGATYGAAGAQWSTSLGYWRVRKISSGAQVGYPVSARNIVGDTSGSVVPVGMLGERIKSSWVTGSISSQVYTVLGSSGITLNAGTYNINVYFRLSPNTTTTLTQYQVFPSTSNANNNDGVIFDGDNMNVTSDYRAGMTNPNGDSIRGMTPTYQIIVPSGSTQTFYPKIVVAFAASTCAAGLQIVAHRIA